MVGDGRSSPSDRQGDTEHAVDVAVKACYERVFFLPIPVGYGMYEDRLRGVLECSLRGLHVPREEDREEARPTVLKHIADVKQGGN